MRNPQREREGWHHSYADISSQFTLGVDLGLVVDYTAVALLQAVPTILSEESTEVGVVYHLRNLTRIPLGTNYSEVARRLVRQMDTLPLSREGTPLVVDRTGVGMGVVDIFTAAGLRPIAVGITNGFSAKRDGPYALTVPKNELVSVLVALYQTGRLKVAQELPAVGAFLHELQTFKRKTALESGRDTYEAWRESDHDDLVLAVALAAWHAENRPADLAPLDPEIADLLTNGWQRATFGGY